METATTVWMWLSLLGILAVPQLLGVLLHFRLRRFSRWLAGIVGTLAAPAIFLFLTRAFVLGLTNDIQADDPTCGMPGVVLGFAILAGLAVEVVVAIAVQLFLIFRSR